MEERRRIDRVKVSLRATWEGARSILQGEIVDLSGGGCFILTDDKVSVGELIRLGISHPEGRQLCLWGEVIYQMAEIGFGVRFTGGEDEDLKSLQFFVKEELQRANDRNSKE